MSVTVEIAWSICSGFGYGFGTCYEAVREIRICPIRHWWLILVCVAVSGMCLVRQVRLSWSFHECWLELWCKQIHYEAIKFHANLRLNSVAPSRTSWSQSEVNRTHLLQGSRVLQIYTIHRSLVYQAGYFTACSAYPAYYWQFLTNEDLTAWEARFRSMLKPAIS